ncbi:MAG: class I SAM-dependent methyltransferase [Endozoicomonas sp.]
MIPNCVILSSSEFIIQQSLETLAQHMNIELYNDLSSVSDGDMLVLEYEGALAVQRYGSKEKPVVVDFVNGAAGHRRKFGGGRGQDIAKAIGLNKGVTPSVLDATGGLGRDAFVLASLGCEVTILERSPIIAALLEDGLRRAREDEEVRNISERMCLLRDNAIDWMTGTDYRFDVVHLDPMFPHREKTALVKKEMRLFQDLLGNDLDADQLLMPALGIADYRVVVKRPRLAPDLNRHTPTYSLGGKSCRYDIYVLKAFRSDT